MSAERHLRVLIAFDSGHLSEQLLRQLPHWLGADALEMIGLYVEDEDLLRAARLPGLREISFSGQPSSLEPQRIGEALAREAAAARSAFELLASRLATEHRQLAHRFVVARGRVTDELCHAADESDFVMVTRTLRATGLRPRLGPSFRELIRQPRHVLFVNEPWASGTSVVVLDGDASALGYGRRLAEAENLRLVLALPPDAPEPTEPGLTTRRLPDLDEERIAELCHREDARLLIVSPSGEVDLTGLLTSLMDRLPCSLLKLA